MPDREPLLDDVDAAVGVIRERYRMAVAATARAAGVEATCRDTLYAALRRRQAVRVAAEVDAPVPCRDCLVEVPIITGAGTYTRGAVVHEIVYESDELPYATCGARR